MEFNYYEKDNKTASVLSVMNHLNLNNLILCNNIFDLCELGVEIETVYYKNINELTLEEINEILLDRLGEPEIKTLEEVEELEETIQSDIEYEYNNFKENYQYYIIPENDAQYYYYVLGYDIFYISRLDLYVLGVNHCGTGWDYVLSDIDLIYSNESKPEERHLIINTETISKKLESTYY